MPAPRKGKTVMRNRVVRCEDELWEAAQAVAAERDEKLSDVVRASLVRYVKRHSS